MELVSIEEEEGTFLSGFYSKSQSLGRNRLVLKYLDRLQVWKDDEMGQKQRKGHILGSLRNVFSSNFQLQLRALLNNLLLIHSLFLKHESTNT